MIAYAAALLQEEVKMADKSGKKGGGMPLKNSPFVDAVKKKVGK